VGVERVPIVFVNAYLLDAAAGAWVLVDTGTPGAAGRIRRAAERRYGPGARPEAIVLTHGHVDHAGTVVALATAWDVPVYAHPLELPYLTGRSDYPPKDPTVGGALGFMSRLLPARGVDLGARACPLPGDGEVPGLPGWRWVHTPGHTAGHVSLFRDADRTLVAGDALATVDQDSAIEMLVTQRPAFGVPPAPFTTDWDTGRESVVRLAELRPSVVAAGHGRPVRGPHVADDLARFASEFTRPVRGRYAHHPAHADERGVTWVPPAVPDPLQRQLLLGAAVAGGLYAVARSRRRARAGAGERAVEVPT
jgi:glyoxylase-like metal-dependent hydrolase (beta-lactamase superfamily II)